MLAVAHPNPWASASSYLSSQSLADSRCNLHATSRSSHSRRSLSCRFILCRVALLCLVLRRRRRLPVPCSRGFSRLSVHAAPPSSQRILAPRVYRALLAQGRRLRLFSPDHLPQANGNLNSFAGPHRLKVQEMLSFWKPPGLATGLSGSALGPGRRAVAAPAGGLQRRPARAYARRRRLRTTPSAARPNEERENEERHAVREGTEAQRKSKFFCGLIRRLLCPGCTATTGIRRLL